MMSLYIHNININLYSSWFLNGKTSTCLELEIYTYVHSYIVINLVFQQKEKTDGLKVSIRTLSVSCECVTSNSIIT